MKFFYTSLSTPILFVILFDISSCLRRSSREISIFPANSPQEIDVKFRIVYSKLQEDLFSRDPFIVVSQNETLKRNETVFTYNSTVDELLKLPLDRNNKTIFVMHGWIETVQKARFWWLPMIDAIKRNRPSDYQVIFVDWSRGSSSSIYLPAVSNLRVTADMVASTIKTLIEDLNFDPLKIRLVGFSLGAHLAGFTGKLLTGRNKLAWITGLEPANAMFEMSSNSGSLYQTDAHYVDVIHSASGNIFTGFSKFQPLGHRDFYINGALIPQPGCDNDMPFGAIGAFFSARRPCNHDRAPLVFSRARDTDSCTTIAFECSSYQQFIQGKCSTVECDPQKDSGCSWFGFENDVIHRNDWPPKAVDKEFKSLYLESSGEHTCLTHYRMEIQSSRTDDVGTFLLFIEDLKLSIESNSRLVALKKPIENMIELSLYWDSGRGFIESILPAIPFIGSTSGLIERASPVIQVEKVIFHPLNPGKRNIRTMYSFCGLHSRQEIKSGSRLILIPCES